MAEANYPTAEETKQKLGDTFKNGDLRGFKANYTEYLEQFPEFKERVTASKEGSIPSINYMLNDSSLPAGEHPENFRLKSTSNDEAKEILKNGRAAQEVLSELSVAQRIHLIDKIEEKFKKYENDIALTITADTTKPIDMSAKEMVKANEWFQYARDNAKKQLGIIEDSKTQEYPALGMAQIIPAGNYPVALAIGPAVGALVSGNSVTISFPDKALNTAGPVMRAFREAVSEFTKDLDILPEKKEALNKGLVQSTIGRNELYKEADIVSFVGSNKVGEDIKKQRADKPTILETGGNNVVTVMNSAVTKEGETPQENAKAIAKAIYEGFGPLSGQRCTAPRILCVQEGDGQKVTKALKDIVIEGPKVGAGGIGNPFEKGVQMGALIDDAAYARIKQGINLAIELKAKIYGVLDANSPSSNLPLPKGSAHFVNPVMIDWSEVQNKNPETNKKIFGFIKEAETFGPLVHIVHPVKDLNHAIEITKTLDKHKLAGAIFTASEDDFKKYKSETGVNSVVHNGAPKDPSPKGMHGTKGEAGVGGENHFANFTAKFHTLHQKPDGLGKGNYIIKSSAQEHSYAR